MACPQWLTGGQNWTRYHVSTFLLTFFSYALFHATRKTLSTVKTSLEDVWLQSNFSEPSGHSPVWTPVGGHPMFDTKAEAETFLGTLDMFFLAAYAIGLYISGMIGDRLDPRLLLSSGMLLTGIITILFGFVSEQAHIYSRTWYLVWYTASGLTQSAGWPTEVAVMGAWFARGSRGFVLGLWSACASIGNIIGTELSAAVLPYGYEYCFLVNGSLLIAGAVVIYTSLISSPAQVGLPEPVEDETKLTADDEPVERKAISICSALTIPGVIPYSLSYACLKLVNYSFFFWLPLYLTNLPYGWTERTADSLSVWYDWGGIFGGLIGGVLTVGDRPRTLVHGHSGSYGDAHACHHCDARHGHRRTIRLLAYAVHTHTLVNNSTDAPGTLLWNGVLMGVTGVFIGGPANLISAAVSADLGRSPSIAGNAEALSTVTGVVDGTGSVGAALGQLLIPALEHATGNWQYVFYMFIAMTLLTAICLLPLMIRELRTVGFWKRE